VDAPAIRVRVIYGVQATGKAAQIEAEENSGNAIYLNRGRSMGKQSETVVCIGDAVKSLGDGKIGGYLVRFSTEKDPDLSGEFFTAKTYFGPRNGDGADMLFHHGIPLKSGLEGLADYLFKPIKAKKDEIGIWVEAVLDKANEYEKAVLELVASGKLGWSSGTAKHLIRMGEGGEIKRWPIVEASLTPTPAEPRNGATAVKTLDEFLEGEEPEAIRAAFDAATTERTYEKALRDAGLSRKTSEVAIGRAKAIFQGDPGELAELKREIEHIKFLNKVLELRASLNQTRGKP
jgi:hypothetical protein